MAAAVGSAHTLSDIGGRLDRSRGKRTHPEQGKGRHSAACEDGATAAAHTANDFKPPTHANRRRLRLLRDVALAPPLKDELHIIRIPATEYYWDYVKFIG